MISGTILGRLGAEPESKQVGDSSVLKLRVATDRYAGKGKGDNGKDYATTWVAVEMWGKRGDALASRLRKGDDVCCRGEMWLREYEGAKGKGSALEMRADDVKPVRKPAEGGAQSRGNSGGGGQDYGHGSTGGGGQPASSDDDIPFARGVWPTDRE